jgi:hypothetical protein
MKIPIKTSIAFLAGMIAVAGIAGGQAAGADRAATRTSPFLGAQAAAPTTVSFRAGARGDTFEQGALWHLKLKPGLYDATFRATLFLQPNDPDATQASAICGIINLERFGTQNTRIFAADSTVQLANGVPAAMSAAATVRIRTGTDPGLVCFAQGSTVQLFQSVIASFTTTSHRTYGITKPVPIPTAKLKQIWQ